MSKLNDAILAAVLVHESLQRIPQPQRSGVTFYSEVDTWLFHAVMDTRTCDLCRHYEDMEELRGDQLRTEFPQHVILDENTIVGPAPDGTGLVHPNCRCYLTRLLQREEPIILVDRDVPVFIDTDGRFMSPTDRETYTLRAKQIFDKVPDWDTDGIDAITVKHEIDPTRPNVMGRYRLSTTAKGETEEEILVSVKLLRSEPSYDEEITIYHEVGHHVWRKLDAPTKASWNDFWSKNLISMPTTYAKIKNPEEGFCECYAYLRYNVWSCDKEIRKWFTQPWFELTEK